MKKERLTSLTTAFMLVLTLLTFMPESALDAVAEDYGFNYCNRQDNKEALYDGSYWIQPERWGIDPIDPSEYTGDAKIWFDKITVKSTEAKGSVQRVLCHVKGAAGKVNSVSVHVLYDTRLTPQRNAASRRYVVKGGALRAFASVEGNYKKGELELVATCNLNSLIDGTLFYIDFKLPDDAKAGDLYPIGIRYEYRGTTYDLFYNSEQDYEGRLTMAHVFTSGIENGYITVEENKVISFDANGGTGTMADVGLDKKARVYTLPECTFAPPEGKEFVCWEYADGSFAGDAGDEIGLYYDVTILRARWKNKKPARIDISLKTPVSGKSPSFEAAADTLGAAVAGEPAWFDGDTPLSAEDIFEEGREYSVRISVKADEGFVLEEAPEVYIGGVRAEEITNVEELARIYTAVFKAQKPDDSSDDKVPDPTLGDVNADGTIDIEDAVTVINHINGISALTDEELSLADIDGSGDIDIEDAVAIINHVNGVSSIL